MLLEEREHGRPRLLGGLQVGAILAGLRPQEPVARTRVDVRLEDLVLPVISAFAPSIVAFTRASFSP